MQIFRNLMIESHSNKTIEYTYGTDFPAFQILILFTQSSRIALKLKTASLLTPSLIPENFNSIGSVILEISHVKTLKRIFQF